MARTHQFGCDMCAFQVRSENENEAIRFGQEHVKETHDMDMSEDDVRNKLQEMESADD